MDLREGNSMTIIFLVEDEDGDEIRVTLTPLDQAASEECVSCFSYEFIDGQFKVFATTIPS